MCVSVPLATERLDVLFTTLVPFPVPPETVIVPILVSILVFPIVAAATICLLRHYNRRARAKDKFR